MSLWITLFAYLMIASAGIGMIVLLMAGHWLGMFFAVMTAAMFALAAIVGIGQARGRRWAIRMARLLSIR